MKTNKLSILGRKVTMNLFMLTALAIFAVSCEEEDIQMSAAPETSVQSPMINGESNGEQASFSAAPAPSTASIAQIATDAGFSELLHALQYVDSKLNAGLVDLFNNGTGQYTVFAPTNEAFKNLYSTKGVGDIYALDAELVLDVLLYHVVDGRRAANSVVPPVRSRTLATLMGETFLVNRDGVITDKAGQWVTIETADISASNGIIHIVDTVLFPFEQ